MNKEAFAQRVVHSLQDEFLHARNFPEVQFRGLEIEETKDDFELVVTFQHERRPECLLRYRWSNIWWKALDEERGIRGLPDRAPAEHFVSDDTVSRIATVMYASLDERLHAGDSPPLPPCEGRSTVWLEDLPDAHWIATEHRIRRAPMPRYGLPPEWKGLRFVGGMEYADLGKPEDVQSIELGHGDPLDSQATELRVDTRLLMTDVHEPSREESLRGLALALWDLSEPRPRGLHPDDARRWHESRERDVRQTPLPPFQKVEIPVDGRPVAFDFLSRESRWVAQGRTDDVKITLIARNLDLANVQLVSVADPEPYIRGGRILLERY